MHVIAEFEQGIGCNEICLEVGQRQNPAVFAVIDVLIDQQRNKETQLRNLYGNGLNVDTIDTILD